MKWHRIYALVLRYLYLYPRSVPRVLDIFFWPITDLLIWGFLTLYLEQVRPGIPVFGRMLLGALIFWNFIHRSQQAVSIAFLEEVWERNLLNLFVTPIKLTEFLSATVLIGFVRIALIGTVVGIASFAFFHFNLFSFGLYLVPFVANLFFFGWVLGLIATSIILRFGQSAQVLAFALTILLQPFAAVFYPVSILPHFLQPVAFLLPITHVFEGMRAVLLNNQLPLPTLLTAVILNAVWFTVAVTLFFRMFERVREKGQLMRLID